MPADPYVVLGVARNASLAEIKTAYRRRVAQTHPDQHPNDPHAAARFRAATAAWNAIQAERGAKQEPAYEAPPHAEPKPPPAPAPGSAKERLVQHAVATGVVATEAAVEGLADRLAQQGGWKTVIGEALRGASQGLAQGARIVMGGEAAARPPNDKNRG